MKIITVIKFIFEKAYLPLLAIIWFFVFLRDWNRYGLWEAVWWLALLFLISLFLLGIVYFIISIYERIKKK